MRRSSSATPYVSALLLTPLAYQLSIIVVPGARLPGGIPASIAILLAMLFAAVVGWTRYQPTTSWPRPFSVWFSVVLLVWVVALARETVLGEPVVVAAAALPLVVSLLWLKRPDEGSVRRAASILGWGFVAASATVLMLEVAGIVPSWYDMPGAGGSVLATFDLDTYWLPLAEPLGLDGRWGGPLRSPNFTGMAGAFLLVFACSCRGRQSVILAAAALLILVLTCSRAAYASSAVGLVLLSLLPGWDARWRRWPFRRVATLTVGVALGVRVLFWFGGNPTLSGRTDVWPDFLSLGSSSPYFGIGTLGIQNALAEGRIPEWMNQGHNVYVDTLVRLGAVGAITAALMLVFAATLTILRAVSGDGLSAALLSTVLLMTVTEAVFSFRYLTYSFSLIFVAVLLAGNATNRYAASPQNTHLRGLTPEGTASRQ